MLVAVCADKGSPGATTTALLLGSVWPRSAVVVELDPSGGDLGLRCRHHAGGQLAATPNILGLAAAARADATDPQLVARFAQRLASGGLVVPGVLAAEQASGMSQLWQRLAAACTVSDVDVVADLGRIHAGAASLPVAAAAEAVVVVATPTLEGVLHLRERINHLRPALARHGSGRQPRFLPVVVTSDRHATNEVAEVATVLADTAAPADWVSAVGYIAHDPSALHRLQHGEDPAGRLRRTLLVRTAGHIVDRIALPAAVDPSDRTGVAS